MKSMMATCRRSQQNMATQAHRFAPDVMPSSISPDNREFFRTSATQLRLSLLILMPFAAYFDAFRSLSRAISAFYRICAYEKEFFFTNGQKTTVTERAEFHKDSFHYWQGARSVEYL